MTTTSIHIKSVTVDDTRTCPTCDGRGQMALRRSHFLLDLYFVRCTECKGSGIAGSFRRIV